MILRLGGLCILLTSCSGDPEPALVRAEQFAIKAQELIHRMELAPYPNIQSMNGRSGVAGLLELLIAEKLMAQAALQAGLDSNEVLKAQIAMIERDAAIRSMIEHDVEDRLRISNAEIDQVRQKLNHQYTIQLFRSASKKPASHIAAEVGKGRRLEEAINYVYGSTVDPAQYTRTITWGDLEPAVENAIFALGPGESTGLLRFAQGYAVARLIEISPAPAASRKSAATVREILRARKLSAVSARYIAENMNRSQVTLKGKLFGQFFDMLQKTTNAYGDSVQQRDVQMSESPTGRPDYQTLLEQDLVTFSGGALTLRQVLRQLRLRGVDLSGPANAELRQKLVRDIRQIAQEHILAKQAMARDFHQTAEVQDEVRLWRDAYLADLFRQQQNWPKQNSQQKTLPAALQTLRQQQDIIINKEALAKIALPQTRLTLIRPGYWPQLALPPWPDF